MDKTTKAAFSLRRWITLVLATSGLACLAIFVPLNAQGIKKGGDPAREFPTDLRGGWCSINRDGERVDIAAVSLEEGDGLCTVQRIQRIETSPDSSYEITMSCEGGTEGGKRKSVVERFALFKAKDGSQLIRAGGMYNAKLLHLYKMCSPT